MGGLAGVPPLPARVARPHAAQGAAHDLWQAFLFAPRDEWAVVTIPMARFLKTWRGKVLDGEHEMSARRVLSVGIALAGGGVLEPPGPYRLALKDIRGVRIRELQRSVEEEKE